MRKIYCDMCGKEIPKNEMDIPSISVFVPKLGWTSDNDIDLCDGCFDIVNKTLNGLLTRKKDWEKLCENKNME